MTLVTYNITPTDHNNIVFVNTKVANDVNHYNNIGPYIIQNYVLGPIPQDFNYPLVNSLNANYNSWFIYKKFIPYFISRSCIPSIPKLFMNSPNYTGYILYQEYKRVLQAEGYNSIHANTVIEKLHNTGMFHNTCQPNEKNNFSQLYTQFKLT